MAGPKRHPGDGALRPFSSKPRKSQPHAFSSFLWNFLLFLFLGPGASGKDSAQMEVPGILEGSVTFFLNISIDKELEHVTWSRPQKALAFASAQKDIIIMDKSYQDRLNISFNSYSLSLNNLTLEDAGPYKAQINYKNAKVTTDKEFFLHLYEQVQEPQVIIKSVNKSDSGSCNVTLICFVEKARTNLLYSWTGRDANASESHEGSTLTIQWTLCHPDLPYTCTARNPVSQNTSSPVRVQQFCTAPRASRGEPMGETVVGVLGESVTLPLTFSASHHIENVVWMLNTSIISKEQKEMATADPPIKFKDPNKNSSQDFSLKIDQVKMENAGHYSAYVCSEASRVIKTKHITLLVYGRLKKPKITWSLELAENDICRVSLTCSVEDSGHNVTYRWTPLPKGTIESQRGPHLNVFWTNGENHPNFTCIASNPVSSSSQQFLSGNICPGPKRSMKFYIVIFTVMAVIVLCLVTIWCIWKRKRPCLSGSAPTSCPSQAETPVEEPGYQELDTLPQPAKQQTKSTSDGSETSEEDQERTDTLKAGRHQKYVLVNQEDTEFDSASEGQAEYDLVTPERIVPAPVAQNSTVYTQVFLNSRGKTSVPQQKENSATIYSSIQTPQKVVPPPQQNDPESPEIPTYENFT
ncbi:T-lymphocyte surface antigen Ly-9 isoform X1 [Vulpes lagopus]|uniref:T-lymphocyte surface antigen Ly-9 isoform X1 n=2 Tax=Vulpes lagopus TaxID=494514 RepID=UPI001BC938D3|nr:T-lymphocyte surface antigen Ly-9 isoform X1 [Vulpes lagopus]